MQPEIIKRWGYPVETHYVTTEDGYILTLFRIPYGKKSALKQPGKPVLLQHGYKATSQCFISRGEKSLGSKITSSEVKTIYNPS